MKKLLVLVLVLTMATIANAGLKIAVDGIFDAPDTSVTMAESDTVIISIYSDGLTTQSEVFYLAIEGMGVFDISGAINNVNSNATGETIIAIGDPIPGTMLFLDMASPVLPSPVIPEGVAIDQLIFHCEGGINDVLVTLSGDVTGVFDTQIIHQIPEPITMTLLGLGGLFLRRRK